MRSAPLDGSSFLAYDAANETMGVCYLSIEGTPCFEATGEIIEDGGFQPTHWMPLPEPPSAA